MKLWINQDSPSLPGITRLCQEDSDTIVQQTPPSVIITKSKSILKRRISDDMFEGSPEFTEDLSDTPLLKQSQGMFRSIVSAL